MKKYLFILLLICVFFIISCDILRFSAFEVISWTPGDGYHFEPENIIVSLQFSNKPHKESVEKYFSFNGNGNSIKGEYLWEEKNLTFIPQTPLEKNTDYKINLSAEARDLEGISMDEAFIRAFSTRPDANHPVVLSCYPSLYEKINDPEMRVKLEFSLPVTLKSLYESSSFNPSMTGFWSLENNDKSAIFTPSEPWQQNNRYEIIISSSLTDINGRNIRKEFKSIFNTGTDHELPYLLNVSRVTKNGEIIELLPDKNFFGAAELPVENSGWEKEDKILLIFSKPVDSLSVKNLISAENAPGLILESLYRFETDFLFKFEKIPVYNNRFTLKIKPGIRDSAGNVTKNEYVYKVFFNGKFSKPPELAGIRLPLAPQNEENFDPIFISADSLYQIIPITDDNYPSKDIISTWIEIYFITAEGASIDLFSVMENFRIDTSNNVLTFSPRIIKTNNFNFQEPQAGLENLQRVEINGNLINTTNYGIVNFMISSGLKDSLGNRNEKSLIIPAIK